jgi:transcriptional regulator MraZ
MLSHKIPILTKLRRNLPVGRGKLKNLRGLGEMTLFLSTRKNKIDKKGRVSIPARFRSILSERGFGSVVLFPSFEGDALNGCDMGVMEGLLEKIGGFDPFSEDRESDADALMAEAVELPIDADGRVVVPVEMLAEIGIEGECVFVGRGDSFQIWEPSAFEARMNAVKERARKKRARSAEMKGNDND